MQLCAAAETTAEENVLCKISKPYTDSHCTTKGEGEFGALLHLIAVLAVRCCIARCAQDELCAGQGDRYGHCMDFHAHISCGEYFRIANFSGVLLGFGSLFADIQ